MACKRLDYKLTGPNYHSRQDPWNPEHAVFVARDSQLYNRISGLDVTVFTRMGSIVVDLHVKSGLFSTPWARMQLTGNDWSEEHIKIDLLR